MYHLHLLGQKRLTWLIMLASLALICLTGRLAWIQFIKGDVLQKKALEVRLRNVPVSAGRGNIYDRQGRILVTNTSTDSLYVVPFIIKDPEKTANFLSPLVNIEAAEIFQRIKRPTCFEWIKRKLPEQTAQQIKALQLPGVFLVTENKRYYPHCDLAAHLLGFTGVDNQGLIGLENSFNGELQGKQGRIVIEQDAAGRELPEPIHKFFPPQQGKNLTLTIDTTIQQFVERELNLIAQKYHPRLAVIIVMNPKTGEILALGNRPSFDPNNWLNTSRQIWDRNPAIWYNYEPGSTFKVITASAALAEKAVKENDPFYCPGYIKVADRYIHCWLDGGHGSQKFSEVVMHSCNPGFVEVGLRLGKERFYHYLKKFGFGVPAGIALPGEAAGIVIPKDKATNLNIATMSLGQSIAVTPVQLLSAVGAIANGGILYRPQIVKKIQDHTGKNLVELKPKPVCRVFPPEAAHQTASLLEKVVFKGTGRNAFVAGYRAAGKTGTAQVVGEGGGYVSGRYVASFAGFAPVDDPCVSALVMVAEPQGGLYYGSQVAAPVFASVVRDTLHYLRVPETPGLKKPEQPFVYEEEKKPVIVPNVINYPWEEGVKKLRENNLNFKTRGEGKVIYGQIPEAGAEVMSSTTVILNLQKLTREQTKEQVTVPDLTGLKLTETADLLARTGLFLEPSGTGRAYYQNIPAGSKVPCGKIIYVEFRPALKEDLRQKDKNVPSLLNITTEKEFIEYP
ncbi:MAG: stage V sporulation protein D [Peptococcaceae bacterium]